MKALTEWMGGWDNISERSRRSLERIGDTVCGYPQLPAKLDTQWGRSGTFRGGSCLVSGSRRFSAIWTWLTSFPNTPIERPPVRWRVCCKQPALSGGARHK